jgi:hypothetical protein
MSELSTVQKRVCRRNYRVGRFVDLYSLYNVKAIIDKKDHWHLPAICLIGSESRLKYSFVF